MAARTMNLKTEIAGLTHNRRARELARQHGLDIMSVTWEDTARDKDSCVGPNISDMTLCVGNTNMPMIRKPNFGDKTCDIPIDTLNVTVGNENGTELHRVSLKEYLQNISKYTGNQNVRDMFLERDEHVLTSAQACVLPLDHGEVEFNVRLFNYQYSSDDPAVLVIVSSSQGTSAQVISEYQQKLYFNKNGQAANWLAKRLEDDRKERNVSTTGEMSTEEKERNVLMVFQVPLKQRRPRSRCLESNYYFEEEGDLCYGDDFVLCCATSKGISSNSRGMDDAMLRVGNTHGRFKGTQGLTLERDPNYPIRMTLQYYKVTDDVEVPEHFFQTFSERLNRLYSKAEAQGSLVVNQKTERKTEPELPQQKYKVFTDRMFSYI